MIRIDSLVRSTRAREVTISATYRPAGAGPGTPCGGRPARPARRHSARNGALVTPAIGARITGVPTSMDPICKVPMPRFSQVRPAPPAPSRLGPITSPVVVALRGLGPVGRFVLFGLFVFPGAGLFGRPGSVSLSVPARDRRPAGPHQGRPD